MRRLMATLGLAGLLAGCGGQAAQATPAPTAVPTRVSTPITTSAAAFAKQPAKPSPTPVAPAVLVVGNTGGDGVNIRRTPVDGQALRAWPDGTKMTVIGPDRTAGGKPWKNVRDPEGNEGWIIGSFLVAAP